MARASKAYGEVMKLCLKLREGYPGNVKKESEAYPSNLDMLLPT